MERTFKFYLTEAPAFVGTFTDMLFASVVLMRETTCFYCIFVVDAVFETVLLCSSHWHETHVVSFCLIFQSTGVTDPTLHLPLPYPPTHPYFHEWKTNL